MVIPRTHAVSSTVTVDFTRSKYIRAWAAWRNASTLAAVIIRACVALVHLACGQTSRWMLTS
jgi:hypothetical protein